MRTNPETSTRYHLVGAPMHTAIELEQTCIIEPHTPNQISPGGSTDAHGNRALKSQPDTTWWAHRCTRRSSWSRRVSSNPTLQTRYHLVGAPMHTAIELEQTCINSTLQTRYHLVGAPMHTAIELEQTCIIEPHTRKQISPGGSTDAHGNRA